MQRRQRRAPRLVEGRRRRLRRRPLLGLLPCADRRFQASLLLRIYLVAVWRRPMRRRSGSSRSSPWHARRSRCAKAKVQSLMVHAGHVLMPRTARQRLLFARLCHSPSMPRRRFDKAQYVRPAGNLCGRHRYGRYDSHTTGWRDHERDEGAVAQSERNYQEGYFNTYYGHWQEGYAVKKERRERNVRARERAEAREREEIAAGIRNPDGALNSTSFEQAEVGDRDQDHRQEAGLKEPAATRKHARIILEFESTRRERRALEHVSVSSLARSPGSPTSTSACCAACAASACAACALACSASCSSRRLLSSAAAARFCAASASAASLPASAAASRRRRPPARRQRRQRRQRPAP